MDNVALEYAKALYSLGKESFLDELNSLETLFKEDEISKFFCYKEINKNTKKDILKPYFNEPFINFIYVLIDNDRLNLINDIKKEYQELILKENNVKQIFVYSNNLLDNNYINKLKSILSKKYNKEIIITNLIDTTIIAGIIIKDGTNIIDLSLNNDFNNLVSCMKE